MFEEVDDASRREKCFTTIAQLPTFIDPKQIPGKRLPFSTIQNHAFVHSAEVILPKEFYLQLKPSLERKLEKPRYARTFMPPSALLEHDFFNTYIKSGNILMISEGRSGSDNVFTLQDGVLRMELGKEIYERTGLTGKPCRSGGRKHAKERFLVELNLRLPSMLHGKKGFERIVWAFTNVLTQSMAWLFHDLESNPGQDEGDYGPESEKGNSNNLLKVVAGTKPINKLQPQLITCEPQEIGHEQIITPPFLNEKGKVLEKMSEGDLQEHCGSLSEWLAMVQMASPRLSGEDDVDPYLSRYTVPDADESQTSDLMSLKWHGLISSRWIMQLFLNLLQSKASNVSWFALAVATLGKEAVEGRDGFTVMVLPREPSEPKQTEESQESQDSKRTNGSDGRMTLCWELMGASVTEP
ncbi:Ribonuclease P Rpp40 [Penicillium rubens]|uniref:Ribonuclease P Rpp40 n=1 Tax=Penicillium rubens TaxID=1108849 RepID=UPI002A5A5144|nr:Ribonuclease P Rpp40 [Penicillium rubens]KAJ5840499.1 Ribonuclease P Rpp40 [Penicillium rubens]KAJ5868477.1 Ribonuclease P Rpp40 [Penicillium rubens]